MCGRYGQTDKAIRSVERMIAEKQIKLTFEPSPYILPTNRTLALAEDIEEGIFPIIGSFIYRPFYNKKLGWINARAEGKHNKTTLNMEDNPNYAGPYRIAHESGTAHAVKFSRCAIPVDYFLEGPKEEGLSEPYLIRRSDFETFFLGGVYSKIDEEFYIGIVTTPAAKLLYETVGHHRSPFVLDEEELGVWLDPELRDPDWIASLFHPFDSTNFVAEKLMDKIQAKQINLTLSKLLNERFS